MQEIAEIANVRLGGGEGSPRRKDLPFALRLCALAETMLDTN